MYVYIYIYIYIYIYCLSGFILILSGYVMWLVSVVCLAFSCTSSYCIKHICICMYIYIYIHTCTHIPNGSL